MSEFAGYFLVPFFVILSLVFMALVFRKITKATESDIDHASQIVDSGSYRPKTEGVAISSASDDEERRTSKADGLFTQSLKVRPVAKADNEQVRAFNDQKFLRKIPSA